LGGVMALEMADQLRRAGRAVPLVLLIDVAVPRPPRRGWDKVRHRITELWRFSWADRSIWLTEQLARSLRLVKAGPDLSEAEALMDAAGMELLVQQARGWQPPQYAGKVYLFRGDRNLRGYPNPEGAHGWERHCMDLEVLSLPCNHAQILVEPQVLRIAAEIQSLLAAVSSA
jgi:thioesterase domain-containing protein